MDIKIHSVRFDADIKLINFIKSKVNKLAQFNDDIIAAEVFLRLENSQDMENKITEIKLDIPGNSLFAKKQGKTFEEATDLTVEALRRQAKKKKEKLRKI
ncbi:MAG: HPF/RaiA family ribosome-associated protein [Marinilabiliales bacterium]|nr:MAG: HPF/RaiA family ribosome-associated protein [Marinilabiliales bacterium]